MQTPTTGPLNSKLILPTTQSYVTHEDMFNEKMAFQTFPGKAKIEHRTNFKTYTLFIYGGKPYITN